MAAAATPAAAAAEALAEYQDAQSLEDIQTGVQPEVAEGVTVPLELPFGRRLAIEPRSPVAAAAAAAAAAATAAAAEEDRICSSQQCPLGVRLPVEGVLPD